MRILHLTLKKQWFDMIVARIKREEYRALKPYWDNRLNKQYDAVRFRNGYSPASPAATLLLDGITIGPGKVEWGAPPAQMVYVLRLGDILDVAARPMSGSGDDEPAAQRVEDPSPLAGLELPPSTRGHHRDQ